MRAALHSELLKVATVRGQWVSAALAAVAIPLTSLLVSASGNLGAGDTVTSGAATGSVAGLLAFGAWAGTVTASEYSRQTLIVSLTTVPNRDLLYRAKLLAVCAIAAVGALVSIVVSWLVVLAVTPRHDHPLGNPAAVLSVVVAVVAVTAIGAASGILTRSPTAAIASVFVVVLLPQAAGGLFGGLQRWVVGASPGTVITQIVGGKQLSHDQTYPLGSAGAALTLLAVAALVTICGGYALRRR